MEDTINEIKLNVALWNNIDYLHEVVQNLMWTEWQWVNGKPDLAGVRSLLHDYGSVRQAFFWGLVGSKDSNEACKP